MFAGRSGAFRPPHGRAKCAFAAVALVQLLRRSRCLNRQPGSGKAAGTAASRRFLDTHAWAWWVTGDRRLSRRALGAICRAAARDGVWISAISIWEMAKKVEKRQLTLDRPFAQWLHEAHRAAGMYVAELTTEILVESCDLPQPFHGDPADQMIVATVRHHRGVLVTRDEQLQAYPHLRTLW